jgi:type IV secretion system protein VirB3
VDKPEGFEIPLNLSLTQPVLMAGVPRAVAILNGTATAALSIGLQVWWLGIPLGLVMHAVAVALTKADPLWLDVFRRQVRLPAHLEG